MKNEKLPAGMKAVKIDNKLVGYVEDVDDKIEAARLAKELLVSKGLWQDVSKTRMIFNQAQSFANTAAYIYEKDLCQAPKNPLGISPFVVNASLSAELYLKCLQHDAGDIKESHILTSLFKSLPNKLKDRINKNSKLLENQYEIPQGVLFKEHLKNINNAFIEWRYIYEKDSEYVNIQQVIFVLQVLHATITQVFETKT